jgi:hypothetical protein
MISAAIDNDIVLKGACYRLLDRMIEAIPCDIGEAGVLGAARFVVMARLRKAQLAGDPKQCIQHLESFLAKAIVLEPSPAETKTAAAIEFAAQQANLMLDVGESQLCAILVERNIPWLATGDKRAIRAVETLSGKLAALAKLAGKVICLEQLIKRTMTKFDAEALKGVICAEVEVDRTLTICFGCTEINGSEETWLQALESYINDLRKGAGKVLSA